MKIKKKKKKRDKPGARSGLIDELFIYLLRDRNDDMEMIQHDGGGGGGFIIWQEGLRLICLFIFVCCICFFTLKSSVYL